MTVDRTALRARAEAATPGPWHATTFEDAASFGVFGEDGECVAGLTTGDDADYIAAASPDVVLALLDERYAAIARAEKAEKERDHLDRVVQEYHSLRLGSALQTMKERADRLESALRALVEVAAGETPAAWPQARITAWWRARAVLGEKKR